MKEFEKYKNYAIWYYLRYFPSIKKLKEKVLFKTQDLEITEKILNSINNIFNEEIILTDKIQICLIRNKNYNYIITSLIKKWFDKEMILEILNNKFNSENQTLLNYYSVKNKIIILKNKNKSINYIKSKLISRVQDKEIINSLIDEIFQWDELGSIEKEYEKIKDKFEKNKVITKLINKGFSYWDIKKILN